ncbi:hypothetical protein BJ170DRAFT_329841 [Xylariales sp. AK1849]|nr:hypothetical protein BJ170DRAFT_329841 [Xylariales sp. AK1849]
MIRNYPRTFKSASLLSTASVSQSSLRANPKSIMEGMSKSSGSLRRDLRDSVPREYGAAAKRIRQRLGKEWRPPGAAMKAQEAQDQQQLEEENIKKKATADWREKIEEARARLGECIRCEYKASPCIWDTKKGTLSCVRCTRAGEKYCFKKKVDESNQRFIFVEKDVVIDDEAEFQDMIEAHMGKQVICVQPGVLTCSSDAQNVVLPLWHENDKIPADRTAAWKSKWEPESEAEQKERQAAQRGELGSEAYDSPRTWRDALPDARNLSDIAEGESRAKLKKSQVAEAVEYSMRVEKARENGAELDPLEHGISELEIRHFPRQGYVRRERHLVEVVEDEGETS